MSIPTKHESTTQPGLFYWAVPGRRSPGVSFFAVVSGGPGLETVEAWDDWFANESDADEIAQKLAKGEL
jgi:hypothetical protein